MVIIIVIITMVEEPRPKKNTCDVMYKKLIKMVLSTEKTPTF